MVSLSARGDDQAVQQTWRFAVQEVNKGLPRTVRRRRGRILAPPMPALRLARRGPDRRKTGHLPRFARRITVTKSLEPGAPVEPHGETAHIAAGMVILRIQPAPAAQRMTLAVRIGLNLTRLG